MDSKCNTNQDILPISDQFAIPIPVDEATDPTTLLSITQPSVTSKVVAPLGPPQKKAKTQVLPKQVVEVVEKDPNSRLRSEAWKHFSIVKNSDPIRAKCNYCGKDYAGNPSKNGTTNFFNHLKNQCKKAPWKIETETGQSKITDFAKLVDSSRNNKSKTLDVHDIRNKLARMVIIDELPFNIVEGEGFIEYSSALEPKFIVPSRVTVSRDCMRLYLEERKKLKKELKGRRVCLTTDTWTSLQNLNYMVLTVHYVDDDWVLQKKILNFCTIESHRGSMIACKLEDCLHSWGIDKILTLTVDNASSNDLCVQELLKDFKFQDVLLDNRFFHVRCHAHILNLVVKDGLKEHFSSIVRVRNACKFVKSSPARLRAFKQCVEKEKIESSHSVILDVETRWNSTYMMLDRAEKYEKAFDRLYKYDKFFQDFFDCYDYACADDANGLGRRKGKIIGPPKKDDWVVARNFVTFLKLFYNVTLKFSTTLDVSANICVPELCKVKQGIEAKMSTQSSSSMFSMAMSMSAKYDKYWSNWSNINHMLFVAIVLDPQFKIRGLELWLRKMFVLEAEQRKIDIEAHLNELFLHYSRESTLNDKELSTSISPITAPVDGENDNVFSIAAREMGEEDNNDSKNELSIYLSDGIEKGESLNVLGWWKSNVLKYPTLSKIAKDIFAIPVSTVASEQAFSTSGRVIDPFRSSLHPTTVEALICAQNWLRGSKPPVDILEALDQVEEYEEVGQESVNSCLTKEGIEVDSG